MGDHHALVENIGVEVSAVRPRYGPPIGNYANFGEAGRVAQIGEHPTEVEKLTEVEFPSKTILEPDEQPVSSQ